MQKAQRNENELRCHCHGAIFDLESGAVRCAPALKPLQKYKIRMDNDSIEVDLDKLLPQSTQRDDSISENVVIIGGGAAGAAAAESLASAGAYVKVLSKESVAGPYDRTLISKRFAEVPLTKEVNENISYLSSTEVLSIDPKAKLLRVKRILPDPNKIGCGPKKKWTFEEMRYSKLIVATGMRPRYLPGQSSGITVYNSSDVERLQELVSGKRVTVVGGSYLGVETAANLVMLKKKNKLESMTLVIGEDHPLSTPYGEMIGKVVRKKLEDFGIEILSESVVEKVEDEKLIFEHGSEHSFGALIQCIGGIPVTSFLPEEVNFTGELVSVNDKFQTSCEDIYAVGDCVKIDGVSYNPHWAAAQEMGKAAATHILTGMFFAARKS
ncbi:Oidioi.mRNA.OKI2018_I69.XSR.g14558.t2.cds [Oikopleura dioica]|uniref:Oidioi.mRNA.OKI2018_I69.XSR.g14558.t2.cds n=1 Tax=Oikopleura dioica TaxID=34765 RepID=A0ABN7SJ35_OIKDI|nr:Oidioi.mRNA.OKI2018_I69.XSR.g14558.t2.cds [Oikopleura dioica]